MLLTLGTTMQVEWGKITSLCLITMALFRIMNSSSTSSSHTTLLVWQSYTMVLLLCWVIWHDLLACFQMLWMISIIWCLRILVAFLQLRLFWQDATIVFFSIAYLLEGVPCWSFLCGLIFHLSCHCLVMAMLVLLVFSGKFGALARIFSKSTGTSMHV